MPSPAFDRRADLDYAILHEHIDPATRLSLAQLSAPGTACRHRLATASGPTWLPGHKARRGACVMTLSGDEPDPVLILASASAARAGMLKAAGVEIDVRPARIDEAAVKAALLAASAPARDVADKLAELKAVRVSARHPGRLVLGADQVLAGAGRLYDKPRDRAEARAQLQALRGRTHELFSAAAVAVDGEPVWRHVGVARLTMRPFTDAFLDRYLETLGDLVLTSVGCYQVEGPGIQLFSRIEGDHFTVLGLPLVPLLGFLRARGVLAE